MCQHPNARLTPRGRETMVARIRGGEGVGEVARQMGAGRQTASRRLARAGRGEPMTDRASRPRTLARLTPREAEDRVCGKRGAETEISSCGRVEVPFETTRGGFPTHAPGGGRPHDPRSGPLRSLPTRAPARDCRRACA
ncbi:leucine zipper domain-containing protein [uncultured Parolsenella sp.]|uniref:leucine zipper domain-containing protein n=1 Tax=uncultured Parolsenella sp. TaxID=2083008 RepID=UPI003453D419